MKQRLLWASGDAMLIMGCATMPQPEGTTYEQRELDRQAILAVAGENRVSSNFEETAALNDFLTD